MRTFDTGATRDNEGDKYDYEGFLSPLVLERFGQYMHQHRVQADGTLRASDNWQKGIPLDAYIKSGWRHFLDWWKVHRGVGCLNATIEDALCALLFNVMGYLHEILSKRAATKATVGYTTNTACVVEGVGPEREVRISIGTSIRDKDRLQVLLYEALRAASRAAHEVSYMGENELQDKRKEINNTVVQSVKVDPRP